MDRRMLTTFPLSSVQKTNLSRCGFLSVGDLKNVDKSVVSQETGLSSAEVDSIFEVIESETKNKPVPLSALNILKQEEERVPIVSFCEKLDEALGGGVQLGQLTELAGIPGVGKTQLCLQLCCDVQIPSLFGGLDGEAVFIDTEAGFVIDRVAEIVSVTVDHCKQIATQQQDPGLDEYMKNFTVERLLSRIHLYKCVNESKLLAVVNLLPSVLQQNDKIKLVVIDSVAFHFRHDFDDMSLRTRILTNLAQTLLSIARKYEIAVVVTNQMTTKVRSRGQGQDTSSVVPALGDSWGHACTNRIILEYGNGCRVASLCKSPSQKPAKVYYQITKDGFRDSVMSFQEETNRSSEDSIESSENPAKRQRYS